MVDKVMRILGRIDWPNDEITRLWDGAATFVDGDGNVWRGCTLVEGLDDLELAINGEASALDLKLMGATREQADLAWLSYTEDQIIGAVVRLQTMPCNLLDQPIGPAETHFTGTIDNILFDDRVMEKDGAPRPVSTVIVRVTNRFSLRRLKNDGVLSDVDQRARAAILNPAADPDRFCERGPLLEDKTIVWPRWN